MKRFALPYLQDWCRQTHPRPLVMRGARQVGKTWLARSLAKAEGKKLIELNFEKNAGLAKLFHSNDPREIMSAIGLYLNEDLAEHDILLFLDEIQVCPELLAKLRWFAEDMPGLPVIAAGSLLDFVLEEYTYSMPVGRITYLYLEPLSFEEFLLALGQDQMQRFLQTYETHDAIPEPIHERLLTFMRDYSVVGGLPAAVKQWTEKQSLLAVSEIQQTLITTYRDDFSKYAGRVDIDTLDDIMQAVPKLLSTKFKYNAVNPDKQSSSIKQGLRLLTKAKICHRVLSCDANGIPLAAEKRDKIFKVIFLDVGLVNAMLGLTIQRKQMPTAARLINEGGLAEQIVGQLLRVDFPKFMDPALYYWVREKSGSSAEIDYVVQHNDHIVPVEVKAGSTGTLRSLHVFMAEKKLKAAVRLNADKPSIHDVNTQLHNGKEVSYRLLSLPIYLTEQLHRLLDVMQDDSPPKTA